METAKTPQIKISYEDEVFNPGTDRSPALERIKALMTGLDKSTALTNVADTGFDANRILLVREFTDGDDNRLATVAFEVPSVAELLQTPEGQAYVAKSVMASINRKYSTAFLHYLKGDKKTPFAMPTSVADFIMPSKQDLIDVADRKRFMRHSWKAYGPEVKKNLEAAFKKKNINVALNMADIEEAMANQQIASIKFPNVAAKVWEILLDGLIKLAPITVEKDGKKQTDNGDLFKNWKANRNTVAETGDLLDMADFAA